MRAEDLLPLLQVKFLWEQLNVELLQSFATKISYNFSLLKNWFEVRSVFVFLIIGRNVFVCTVPPRSDSCSWFSNIA